MASVTEQYGELTSYVVDTVLKTMRDNTVGSHEQILSMGFSNTSKIMTLAISESLAKHFLDNNKLDHVSKLTQKHFEAIGFAVDRQRSLGMLEALRNVNSPTNKHKELYNNIRDSLWDNLQTANDKLDKTLKQLNRFDIDLDQMNTVDIVDEIIDKRYGKYLFENIVKIFDYGNFIKALNRPCHREIPGRRYWRLQNSHRVFGCPFSRGRQSHFLRFRILNSKAYTTVNMKTFSFVRHL